MFIPSMHACTYVPYSQGETLAKFEVANNIIIENFRNSLTLKPIHNNILHYRFKYTHHVLNHQINSLPLPSVSLFTEFNAC